MICFHLFSFSAGLKGMLIGRDPGDTPLAAQSACLRVCSKVLWLWRVWQERVWEPLVRCHPCAC